MKYAEGDIYHALRGQVVETSKHAEQWRQAEQYEATQRAKMGDGKRGDSNGPAGKISGMSGAQQRNMKNSEGTVDWAEKFSTDTRYSHVDFARQGVAKKRKEEGVDIDAIAAAAKAFAAQKAQQSSISTNDPDATSPSGEGAPDSGSKRKRDAAAPDDTRTKTRPASTTTTTHAGIEPSTSGFPPFTLPPSDANLAKRINTVAGFVHKNGAKFETVTRTKQAGNPEFAFLTQGGDGYEYYAWLKHANAQGVDPAKPIGMTADDSFDAAKLAEAARKIAEAAAYSSGKCDGDGIARSGDGTQGGAANEGNKGSGTGNKGNKGTRVGPWQAVKDATGRTYYWNRDTAATTWTPPDGFT